MAAPRRTPHRARLHRSHDQPFHDGLVCSGCACARIFAAGKKRLAAKNALRRVVLRAAGAQAALWVAGDRALPPQICR
jgi:hypothetical protein